MGVCIGVDCGDIFDSVPPCNWGFAKRWLDRKTSPREVGFKLCSRCLGQATEPSYAGGPQFMEILWRFIIDHDNKGTWNYNHKSRKEHETPWGLMNFDEVFSGFAWQAPTLHLAQCLAPSAINMVLDRYLHWNVLCLRVTLSDEISIDDVRSVYKQH